MTKKGSSFWSLFCSSEVPAQDFPALQILAVRAGVVDLRLLELERLGLPDARRIVQGQDEFALHARQQLRQLPEVLTGKEALAIVILVIPVRRINVKEGGRLIVAPNDLIVWQALYICPRQTQMCCRKSLFDTEQIEFWTTYSSITK
jgi:hypothetical protein